MEEIPNSVIGDLSGKIWRYLSTSGRVPMLKLKIEMGVGNSMLFLAAGWLARENKVIIEKENNDYYISLVK
jgi:hypothetical protein